MADRLDAIQEINALEIQIASAENNADAMLWRQAFLVVAQYEAGLSQQQIADQWFNAYGEKYTQRHVSYVIAVVQKHASEPRPRFRVAYNDVAHARTTLVADAEDIGDVVSADGGKWRVDPGDAWALATQPLKEPIQAIITSPPYWHQRIYQDRQEFGGQETVAEYVTKLVALFEALKLRLCPSGAAWINLGDSYEH